MLLCDLNGETALLVINSTKQNVQTDIWKTKTELLWMASDRIHRIK